MKNKLKLILAICLILVIILGLGDAIRGFKDGFISGNPF